jgi:2-keto-3-deoxy-L-rhamnonate aldolase RhmA
MSALKNATKERLKKGELALGLNISRFRTVEAGRVAATCGYDWAFIDMEHTAMDLDIAAQLCIACQDAGVTPIVRVAGYEHYHATKLLDAGAMGIIFPHVDTAELVEKLVKQCKYPPRGHRSVAGAMAQLNFQAMPLAESTKIVNDETMIVVMVESPLGVKNVDAIAAVPGLDSVLIGTNDLCMELGIPGQLGHADIKDAYRKVIAACRKHGKYGGLGGVYDDVLAKEYIEMGMRFIIAGSDLSLMMQGAGNRAKFLRAIPT